MKKSTKKTSIRILTLLVAASLGGGAYAQASTGASGGFPATINQFCYDNTGATITAGTTPVSLQTFSVD